MARDFEYSPIAIVYYCNVANYQRHVKYVFYSILKWYFVQVSEVTSSYVG